MTSEPIILLYTEDHSSAADAARGAVDRNTHGYELLATDSRNQSVAVQLNQAMKEIISKDPNSSRIVVFLSTQAIVAKDWLLPLTAAFNDRTSVVGTLLSTTDVPYQVMRSSFDFPGPKDIDHLRLDAFVATLLAACPPVQTLDPVCIAFKLSTWQRTGILDSRFDGRLAIADWAMRAVERTALPRRVARNSFVWIPQALARPSEQDAKRYASKWVLSGRENSLLHRTKPRPVMLLADPIPATEDQQSHGNALSENLIGRGFELNPLSGLSVTFDPRTLPAPDEDAFYGFSDEIERMVLKVLECDRETHPPDISVCMIVKNEEAVIERCLQSVRSLARQLLVLDTGSTDQTKSIAEKFGAEVHDFESGPEFDFSAARNASLSYARCGWILVLDADECFLPSTAEAIRQIVDDNIPAAYNIDMRRYLQDAATGRFIGNDWIHPATSGYPGYYILQKTSLWPRQAGIKYSGEVHEHVVKSVLQAGIPWLDVSLEVHEIGHRLQGKARDYSAIGRRRVQSWPTPQHYLTLGIEMTDLGNMDEALNCFEHALALVKDPIYHVGFSNDPTTVASRISSTTSNIWLSDRICG